MKLEQLLEGVPYTLVQGSLELDIEDIIYDSRKAAPGRLFVCIVGTQRDSHDYAAQCVADGVTALVVQHDIDLSTVPGAAVLKVESSRYALALMSGIAVLLKGGREAERSNAALCDALREAAADVGLPADFAQLLHSREDVAAMLKEDALIDLIIPRGSKEFVRYIMDNSRIPVLGHSDGICHVYVDKSADVEMAVSIAVDSKAQNVAVCNACETLLVHRDIAADFLPKLLPAMQEKHVRLLGDEATRAIIPVEAATEEDWRTEYLDYVLSIRVVDSLEAAIAHINRYGSHHTDCIVTRDDAAAKEFLTRVDSAGVYRNVSTRFADGFVYGFGAEVGIATGKLHARGPMGLDGLTTYKYKLLGDGQLMAEMKSGQRAYTHLVLHEDCPL